ncbi:MAG: phage terminase large subunit [Oscillospiraceae bacterium]|nr:phage terminase large subunit [Oscillospiraceae bacterium]
MKIEITKKQQEFINSTADEVLFGGAAGGGKSYGQLIDAFLYAMKYPRSKQLILRRTLPELEKSLIRVCLGLFDGSIYRYNAAKHTGTFSNGSIIDFGYCDRENDVYKYQSAEYDIIRFDELTHFTEDMYIYLMSRLRGTNSYPKQIKSSTNPGGVGHSWVKERFIDRCCNGIFSDENGTRQFIPAKVSDNSFLMKNDKGYINRLNRLGEKDRRALLYGDWDIFDGQYFSEFRRSIHVVRPFSIPKHWKRYFTMDYGLDMFAGYFIAVDTQGKAYVYREIYKPNLIISAAAKEIIAAGEKDISVYYAPPDLYSRRQDTGKSVAEIFAEHGILLAKSENSRVQGWYNLKEWLTPYKDEMGNVTANMVIFENCTNLIRTLPALTFDRTNPNDVAVHPHEITHAPDAIRYFVSGRPSPALPHTAEDEENSYDRQIEHFIDY